MPLLLSSQTALGVGGVVVDEVVDGWMDGGWVNSGGLAGVESVHTK